MSAANASLRNAVAAAEATVAVQAGDIAALKSDHQAFVFATSGRVQAFKDATADEIRSLKAELAAARSAAQGAQSAAEEAARSAAQGVCRTPRGPPAGPGQLRRPAAGFDDCDDDDSVASDASAEALLRTMREQAAATARLLAASVAAAPRRQQRRSPLPRTTTVGSGTRSRAPPGSRRRSSRWRLRAARNATRRPALRRARAGPWEFLGGSRTSSGAAATVRVTGTAGTPPTLSRDTWHPMGGYAASGTIFFHKHDEHPFGVFSQWAASAFSEELVAGAVDDLTVV